MFFTLLMSFRPPASFVSFLSFMLSLSAKTKRIIIRVVTPVWTIIIAIVVWIIIVITSIGIMIVVVIRIIVVDAGSIITNTTETRKKGDKHNGNQQ